MKALTEKEQMVMSVLWEHRHCGVEDVISHLDEPKPAYNTILTFLRILEQKGFIYYETKGKKHIYYPIIEKGEYTRWTLPHQLLPQTLWRGLLCYTPSSRGCVPHQPSLERILGPMCVGHFGG